MTSKEFVEATNKLEKYYDKEYTKDQIQIMFKELKEMGIERYRQLISAIIRKNKFLPKVADFIEMDKEIPRVIDNSAQKVECKKCDSLGIIIYKKMIANGNKRTEYLFGSRCNCANGKNLPKEIPSAQELGIIIEENDQK